MTDNRTSHWQFWVPLVSALVGVALGGFISNATAERQIEVAQEAEQRTIRAEVYLAFLDAVDDYANTTQDVLGAHDERGRQPSSFITANRADSVIGPWLSARVNFQDALNRVSIYGSDEGWNATRALARTLPASVGTTYEFVEVGDELDARYRDLLTVLCQESTISPREDCTQ